MTDLPVHPFVALLAAHVLVDFIAQSDRDVREKAGLRPLAFLRHALQHGAAAWLLVGVWTAWIVPLAVFVVHGAIDVAKESTRRVLHGRRAASGHASDTADLRLFTFDQFAHVASLVLIARFVAPDLVPSTWTGVFGAPTWTGALVLVIGLVVAVRTGAVVVALGVRRFQRDLDDADSPDTIRTEPRGLSGGGAMIGALERALVFFFVMTGMPQGVGFLLAAKSILRFGDLNARQQRVETEYVIIGTLASFAWSLVVAWTTRAALAIVT